MNDEFYEGEVSEYVGEKLMTKPNDSAFPVVIDDGRVLDHGLTKREYFAAMIAQGMATSIWSAPKGYTTDDMVKDAVIIADKLILELSKGEVK